MCVCVCVVGGFRRVKKVQRSNKQVYVNNRKKERWRRQIVIAFCCCFIGIIRAVQRSCPVDLVNLNTAALM